MKTLNIEIEICQDCPFFDELLDFCHKSNQETQPDEMPEWCELDETEDKIKTMVREIETLLSTANE